MSEEHKEKMSALMDGELTERSAGETVDVLLGNDELRLHWSRYHVVRDVLRHKAYPDAGTELTERVQASLADEPLHFPARRLLPRRWRETLKPAAGIALAASVAAVAVLAVRGVDPGRGAEPVTPVVEHRLAGATPAVIPVASNAGTEFRPASLRRLNWSTDEPAVANRLNGYLVNHSERLGSPMGAMHPYARIVGYDSADRR